MNHLRLPHTTWIIAPTLIVEPDSPVNLSGERSWIATKHRREDRESIILKVRRPLTPEQRPQTDLTRETGQPFPDGMPFATI